MKTTSQEKIHPAPESASIPDQSCDDAKLTLVPKELPGEDSPERIRQENILARNQRTGWRNPAQQNLQTPQPFK
jgi:hypothetical protein